MEKLDIKSTLVLGVLFFLCSSFAMNRPKQPDRFMWDLSHCYEITYLSYNPEVNAWIVELAWLDFFGKKRQEGQFADNKDIFGSGDDDKDLYRMHDKKDKKYYFMPYSESKQIEDGDPDVDVPFELALVDIKESQESVKEKRRRVLANREQKIGMTITIEYENPDCWEPYPCWNRIVCPPEPSGNRIICASKSKKIMKRLKITI